MAQKLKTLKELGIMAIPETNNRMETMDRVGDHGDNCIVCGKRTKKQKYFVFTVEGPEMVLAGVTEEDMEANGLYPQGCFDVGSKCRKLLPKGYIQKYASTVNK
tara:strand:+ start:411 stop:722 length:312 start_codon:yes stop_codon:yes gene_type:complete